MKIEIKYSDKETIVLIDDLETEEIDGYKRDHINSMIETVFKELKEINK